MKQQTILSICAVPVLLVFDLTWTGVIANGLYESQLGQFLSPHPILLPLIAFYVIYAIGLAHFVIKPALNARSGKLLVGNAILLALVGYGTYDLVSLGVNAGWPALISFVDIGWGISLSLITSTLVYWFARKVLKY